MPEFNSQLQLLAPAQAWGGSCDGSSDWIASTHTGDLDVLRAPGFGSRQAPAVAVHVGSEQGEQVDGSFLYVYTNTPPTPNLRLPLK